jgi:serine/threonine protein kinase
MNALDPAITYCINPNCHHPNPEELEQCEICGTPLLINNRYRAIRPLRDLSPSYATDIYEVEDWSLEPEQMGTKKVLKILKLNSSRLSQLFEEEARVLIWLRHPCIPKVESVGSFTVSCGNTLKPLRCLVMEQIPGLNLAAQVEKTGAIASQQAIAWLSQIAEILAFVHDRGLLHRDIKPDNIMLQPDGKLVLIDFGIVGNSQGDRARVGTPNYMAPEQKRGNAVVQSDLYALGRTMVHLLTGQNPINLPEREGQLLWRERVSGLNPQFAALIDNLIATSVRERPASAMVVLDSLHRLGTIPSISEKRLLNASWPAIA